MTVRRWPRQEPPEPSLPDPPWDYVADTADRAIDGYYDDVIHDDEETP